MNPIEWLEKKAPGFDTLSSEEREAISYFVFLWSLFEAKAMNTSASAKEIVRLVKQWEYNGSLDVGVFAPSIAYFQQRYFSGGSTTHHFDGLNLRANDKPALVKSVLSGQNTNPADCVACLLIVIYRLRNNLFHGVKWVYGIQGQLQNFLQSNNSLMAALSVVDVP